MDSKPKVFSEEIASKLEDLLRRVENLEHELALLKGTAAPEEPAPVAPEEPIDFSLPEDFQVIPVDIEDIPAPAEPAQAEESLSDLFGAEPVQKPAQRGRRRRILNDLESGQTGKSVMDVLSDKAAWRHDMPGPDVKSLRSAIGLGDQVLFIRRLFRDDPALYQDSIDKLNSMSTLDQAIAYLSDTFPEWDVASDDVYRFMMAVRRKIRR